MDANWETQSSHTLAREIAMKQLRDNGLNRTKLSAVDSLSFTNKNDMVLLIDWLIKLVH
jgi:hypothetical protein